MKVLFLGLLICIGPLIIGLLLIYLLGKISLFFKAEDNVDIEDIMYEGTQMLIILLVITIVCICSYLIGDSVIN